MTNQNAVNWTPREQAVSLNITAEEALLVIEAVRREYHAMEKSDITLGIVYHKLMDQYLQQCGPLEP
jgi:hypothetical protein